MIGIGVGIDYALFIVTRYRAGPARRARTPSGRGPAHRHLRPRRALRRHHRGHLPARHVPDGPVDFMRGWPSAPSSAVLMTMLAALTLLPACWASSAATSTARPAAPRAARRPTTTQSVWYRWSRVIQRRPWPALVVGAVDPARPGASRCFGIRLGFGDAGNRRRPTPPAGLRPAGRRLRPRLQRPVPDGGGRPRTARPTWPRSTSWPRRSAQTDGVAVGDAAAPERGRHGRGLPASSRPRAPQDEATDGPRPQPARRRHPRRHRRHRPRRAGHRRSSRRRSTSPTTSPHACRSSSAPCCCCRFLLLMAVFRSSSCRSRP